MKILFAVLISLFPTFAQAACVTRADLVTGVTVTVDDEYYKSYHFIDRGNDLVETTAFSDRWTSNRLNLWGIYPKTETWTTEMGEGRSEFRYGRGPVRPAPDMVWTATITEKRHLLSNPGKTTNNERRRWTYEFGTLDETKIGRCLYHTMTLHRTHGGSRRYAYGETLIYFVDLGIAVSAGSIGSDLVYPMKILSMSRGLK
jgi:hypothetical protein